MSDSLKNWAGNYRFRAAEVAHPSSLDEVRALVSDHSRVRALGTRHSFNDLADSPGVLVSLDAMPDGIDIDPAARTVTASAGMRYGDLAAALQAQGWALHNLASLPHISLAGTVATGTHGSGSRNGSLSTAVAAIEMVTAEGDVVTIGRGDPDFGGVVVSLGALGVVTRVTLDIEPTFEVEQRVFVDLPFETVERQLTEILAQGYSTSLFTRWHSPVIEQLWVKSRAGAPSPDGFGGTAAATKMHPIVGVDPVNCTDQLGEPGPWLDRLPHFKLGFTPSAGEELQSEFFVAAHNASAAFRAIADLAEVISPLLLVNEIRAVAADELWLSGAYARDTVAFHFTWQQREDEVREVLTLIEAALRPFDARPHWAKVFTARAAELRGLYPRMDDFLALRARLDPTNKFTNDYLERVLLAEGAPL